MRRSTDARLHLMSWQDYPTGDGSGVIELRWSFGPIEEKKFGDATLRIGAPICKIERIPYTSEIERTSILDGLPSQ